MAPGLHTAELSASPSGDGPVVSLPITVIRPVTDLGRNLRLEHGPKPFVSGHLERIFVTPPANTTWMKMTVTAAPEGFGSHNFVLHAVQLVPQCSYDDHNFQRHFPLAAGDTWTADTPVVPLHTLEVCLGQMWNSLGGNDVTLTVEFHGVDADNVVLSALAPTARVVRVAS